MRPLSRGDVRVFRDLLARPALTPLHLVLVHRLAPLLHASFRTSLATTPLRFAITSLPSGCQRDFHPQAVDHARRTKKGRSLEGSPGSAVVRTGQKVILPDTWTTRTEESNPRNTP